MPDEPGSGGLRLGPVSVSPQALGQFQSSERRRTNKLTAPTAPRVAPFRHPRSGAGRKGWDAVSGGSKMGQTFKKS
ncbi:hypothetical protein E2C01_002283 [Portunus trituberculatus]|uniref:Uncharacterized protein n=1 Tax=Portunus trituberculatus TaxID=210409 RepID=A0A5B7CJB8_PORTR|nr:hypothetical protein [Portunus trituberculatus]